MMKKLMMFALVLTLGLGLTTARDKKTENVKTTTFVADIHCENCSTKVMNNVPALGKGIKDVDVDLAQKTITVTYDAEKNNDVNIINGFRSLNINAQAAKKDCDGKACKAEGKHECADKKDCGAAKHECADKKDCGAAKHECADKKDCAAAKHECADKKDCGAAKHECADKKDCGAAKHECADKKDCAAAKHECADKKDCGAAKHECADKKDCGAAKHECSKDAAKKDCCKDK